MEVDGKKKGEVVQIECMLAAWLKSQGEFKLGSASVEKSEGAQRRGRMGLVMDCEARHGMDHICAQHLPNSSLFLVFKSVPLRLPSLERSLRNVGLPF